MNPGFATASKCRPPALPGRVDYSTVGSRGCFAPLAIFRASHPGRSTVDVTKVLQNRSPHLFRRNVGASRQGARRTPGYRTSGGRLAVAPIRLRESDSHVLPTVSEHPPPRPPI